MTLLELLVAMTLLSLVGLAMFGGLRFGMQVWDRSTNFADEFESIEATQRLLRREFSAIYPAWQPGISAPGHVRFEGSHQRLAFIAPPPAQFAPGPNNHYELSLSSDGALRLQWAKEDATENEQPSQAVLLSSVRSLELSYYGDNTTGYRQWQDDWTNQKELPLLIRMRLSFAPGDHRRWPDLVVHPKVVVDVSCIYDPVNFGCRGR